MSIKNVLKRLSPIHIVALVCAVLIFAAVVTSAVFFGIGLAKDAKKEFDFTKNPEKYIEINYKEAFDIAPEYKKIRDVDINNKILALVAGEKNKNSGVSSKYDANTVINVGDEVKIYYRGYVLIDEALGDVESNRDYQEGMTNFDGKILKEGKEKFANYASMQAYNLPIDGTAFVPGFALALDGEAVGNFPQMKTIRGTDINVDNTMFVFVNYDRSLIQTNIYSGVESTKGETGTAVMIDLSTGKDKIDATFGIGFYDILVGVKDNPDTTETDETVAPAKVNGNNVLDKNNDNKKTDDEKVRLDIVDSDEKYEYSSIVVEYAIDVDYYVKSEDGDQKTYYDPIKVEFPANYAEDLAGKTGYFDILIVSVKEYGYDNVAEDAVSLETLLNPNASADKVAAAKAVINPILMAALEEKDEDFMKTIAEEDKATADYFALYSAYLRAEDEKNNDFANKNIRNRAIIDALVATSSFKADNYEKALKPYVDAKYDATLITFLEAYSQNKSSYTIEKYAELYFDLTSDEYYTTVGEGEDEVKVYDWHKAARTTAENYYKERLVIQYIIDKANLNDGTVVVNDVEMTPYEAAYKAVCDEYSAAYKISYANQNDIDLENMTEKEAKQVRDAVNAYLASNIGYDYLTEFAHYQLVLDCFTVTTGEDGKVVVTFSKN